MADTFPISCISCRRKKIKCNKSWPCDQCRRRYVSCEFPSTFRNIKINEGPLKSLKQHDHSKYELDLLKVKNDQLQQEKYELVEQNQKLIYELEKQGNEHLAESNRKFLLNLSDKNISKIDNNSVPISDNINEVREKFYDPQKSKFIIDKSGSLKENTPENDLNFKKKEISVFQHENVFKETIEPFNSIPKNSDAFMKKSLPFLLRVYPNLTDIESIKKNYKLNIDTIKYLVTLCFEKLPQYKTFININDIYIFLDNSNSVKIDECQEYDNDLLLLYMVLIISINNLTPQEFYYLNFLCGASMDDFEAVKRKLIYDMIFVNFEKLRHNLIIESITTIQAYILSTYWYFSQQMYEECWSIMFHSCSIAYAIGLHVVSNFKYTENPSEEEKKDASRYKIWFALKDISGQVCSILGRPNPISIQVCSSVLKSTQQSNEIDLNKIKTHILLKIGFSECLRLSNLMLIENFLMDFTMCDLLSLDQKFEQEIESLKWFLKQKDLDNNLSNIDPEINNNTQTSVKIEKNDLLMDLAILYINKAKLLESFVSKFENTKDISQILLKLTDSILNFLNYIIIFRDLFFTQLQVIGEHDIDCSCKYFRHKFPFLNAFVYQGIIVIYTLLHYKYDKFSEIITKSSNNFLEILEQNLVSVLYIDRNLSDYGNGSTMLWSANTVYLINRVLQQIHSIIENSKNKSQAIHLTFGMPNASQGINSEGTDTKNFFGFHMNDPFWLTDPGKLPHFLTSPFGGLPDNKKPELFTNLRHENELTEVGVPQPPPLSIPQPPPLSIQQPTLMNYNNFFDPTASVQNQPFSENIPSQRIECNSYFYTPTSVTLNSNLQPGVDNSNSVEKKFSE